VLPAEADRAAGTALVAARALTIATALILVAAVCGDEDDDGGSDSGSGATELSVKLDPDGPGGQEAMTESIVCEAGADDSVCASLTAEDMAPVPPDTACTEIYGGPDEATLEGTIAGEPVSAAFTRANGCEIERFDRIAPLLRELFPDYKPGASLAPA
jgi:hypothetical protein